MNLDKLAERYKIAIEMDDKNKAHLEINNVLKEAASNFPRDREEDLAWFIAALQDKNKKWFVAKLMGKVSPVPKSLLNDLVLAAMTESNPSSNKFFVSPCVKTFGVDVVRETMNKYANHPRVIEVDGYEKTEYWVGGASA